MPEFCRTSAFYVPPEGIASDGGVVFDSGESGHIARVLRLGSGDSVEVLDGRGGVYEVELTEVSSKRVQGAVRSRYTEPEPSPAVSAAVALGRKERLRFAVEKLAELGCRRFWPLDCDNLQFPGKLGSQTAKLRGAAVAALKQSRRPYLTEVENPLTLVALLDQCDRREIQPVICQPDEGESIPLHDWAAGARKHGEYLLIVGPEGGFSEREAEVVAGSGYPCLSLGRYWLRSETAVISGVTLLIQSLRHEFSVTRQETGENK